MLVGLGKSLAVIFQGAWLIQIAAVEYESEWMWRPLGGQQLQGCSVSCRHAQTRLQAWGGRLLSPPAAVSNPQDPLAVCCACRQAAVEH